jgi:hypothetical protein
MGEMIDGRDIRRIAALHRGQQALLIFKIGNGRDLDAWVLRLEL